MNNIEIRFANKEDCQEILNIYSPFIESSPITFETVVPSLLDFEDRFEAITSQYPWLVSLQNTQLTGYAYASTYRAREAYSWSCEVTVYVDPNHHKKGIATKLYNELFAILKEQGYRNLLAGVTLPNPASLRAHEKLGFKKIGEFENVGFKNQGWYNVTWLQKEINGNDLINKPLSIIQWKENQHIL